MLAPARYIVAFSAIATCTAVQAAEQAYRYLDAEGKPVYSQLPPPPGVRHDKVDVSPAGGQGKGKTPSGDTRRDDRDRAKHSTASGAVPYKDVWRQSERKVDQAAQEPAPVVKAFAAPANPQCAAGQGADCKAAGPSK